MRIISLLPSTTELAVSIGLKEHLVGRSHECDYPAGLDHLPVLTKPKYHDDGNSRQTDDRVKDLLRRGLSVYEVDEVLLKELKPDLILTQDHCEVCAASIGDVENALSSWTGRKPGLVSVSPLDLNGIFDSFLKIGEATGRESEANKLSEEIQERLEIIRRTTNGEPRKRVATIEWIDPLMTAGNWIPELTEFAGGEHLLGEAGKHSPFIDWETITETDPDLILVMPCGYSIEKTLSEMETLTSRPGWSDLRAVNSGEVYILDGHHYFNRPGPRIFESARIMAEIFHPERFKPTLEESGWIRYNAES